MEYMVFYVECYCYHRDLHVLTHSFPTRRSSDLGSPETQSSGPRAEAWPRSSPVISIQSTICGCSNIFGSRSGWTRKPSMHGHVTGSRRGLQLLRRWLVPQLFLLVRK